MKTAFFPPKLRQGLPGDNVEALAALCGEFERFDGHARQLPEHHGDYVEALSILRGFAIARELNLDAFPQIGPQQHQNVANVSTYFSRLRDQTRSELTGRYSRGYFETKTEEYVALFSRVSV